MFVSHNHLTLHNNLITETHGVIEEAVFLETYLNHHHRRRHQCGAAVQCGPRPLRSPALLLSILCPHSPTSDDYHPDVFIHVSYPAFSGSFSYITAIDFFIQDLSGHTMIIHSLHLNQPADPP
jgi:hypothetical protein